MGENQWHMQKKWEGDEFFFLFFEISLWGKNERKRKKKNVLKECCRC